MWQNWNLKTCPNWKIVNNCQSFLFHFCHWNVDLFTFGLVEGFIEAKIERFGQALVNKVIEVCNKFPVYTEADNNVDSCDSK